MGYEILQEASGNHAGEWRVTMVAMSDYEPPAPANPVLSVSRLNRLVRDCLEAAFPLTWVAGEISNLTFAASGHVYFSLKDASAQVRCVMWRNRAQLLGWRPENGQQVEARALVSFYEPRGEFQPTSKRSAAPARATCSSASSVSGRDSRPKDCSPPRSSAPCPNTRGRWPSSPARRRRPCATS